MFGHTKGLGRSAGQSADAVWGIKNEAALVSETHEPLEGTTLEQAKRSRRKGPEED